ncbi:MULTISPECIES: Uma2 family endonuclease [Okeania]|uniref:Uma2 family endonuclease n=1 Tax=Okeania hirsuta TaxID=1458930 RepID=A0A3N6P255_9CYAN|nr:MULTISPECIES: Uma2 family endonuclease [Okeania]NET16156.1 Uma2 family endonuclease [Okeania sp. SIO1H6]NES79850.1 Uma2 family endonuclease [Okeania sp. SIO1H4]NES90400.1 Uma2 family endonuclease [Okeania sp. SIO2B9]NET23542.1 Uma2 family endonuclease [Okeania sp. SIO1H5]NET80239.1 Uma2 family endonuclease [Okeania sp. SIO1F9]
MPSLTVKDLEKLQVQHPDYRMELVSGEIIFMSPSGLESEEVTIEIAAQLRNWVRPRKLGRVSGSSAGFRLPNADGDVRTSDASFILAERLPPTTEGYAELVPDLMFEVKSKTDSLTKLCQKIQEFLELGTKVGVLVDPRTRTMEVYRLNRDKVVLGDGDVLQVPELLPGWELPVVEVWAPEFD